MPYSQDGKYVSVAEALEEWEPVAFDVLIDTARTYNGYITYKSLTDRVQDATGITFGALIANWVGGVLGYVLDRAVREGLPPVTSLCVTAEGTVGKGYAEVLRAYGRPFKEGIDNLDDQAAIHRLECYCYFGAQLPPGGGEPTLTPKAKAAQDWKKAAAKQEAAPKLCPVHFVALPVTGKCDDCEN